MADLDRLSGDLLARIAAAADLAAIEAERVAALGKQGRDHPACSRRLAA